MKQSLRLIVSSAVACGLFLSLQAAPKKTAVAIVIDAATFNATSSQVSAYADAITRHDGKNVCTVVVPQEWTPQEIRDTLRTLKDQQNLEGAVLVGDIPVPMIRHAHHLATAFKMNPGMPWNRSSIPSDRFYDDFDLEFTFLKQDEKQPQYYYYDLSPEGRQIVGCDIYTARIKPARTAGGPSFTDLVARFLEKAVQAKAESEVLDNVFHFGGHGNSSESFNARIDEDRAMYEQFGLAKRGGQVHYLNFDEDRFVRSRLKAVLADPTLDYAHLHTHGAVGAQYISKEPYTFVTGEHLENAKFFFRGRMRSAKDKEKTRRNLMETYHIPESWLAGWDDPAVSARDSVRAAAVDIVLEDLDGYQSGVKVLILDACFNGAFLHDDYIAARYAFAPGSQTLAVFGNSVNIIQDHWKNELAGVLAEGVCVGNWARQNMTLESHLFGDPTFSFSLPESKRPVLSDLDNMMTVRNDAKIQKKLWSTGIPDLQGWALKDGYLPEATVLQVLDGAASMNLRMEAFLYLIRHATAMGTLVQAISAGLDDSYELIRRMAARYAETCGDAALLKDIARHYLDPKESARVRYHLMNALGLYPFADVKEALEEQYNGIWPEKADFKGLLQRLETSYNNDCEEFASVIDPKTPEKDRAFVISAQRNRCHPDAVNPMLRVVAAEDAPQDLRIKAAEALGWYVQSFRREEIYKALLDMTPHNETVRDEVRRTLRRLEDNAFTK